MPIDKLVLLTYDLCMIPRGILDIGWRDLWFAAFACLRPLQRRHLEEAVRKRWGKEQSLVCLSVRSGFDLLLQALQLPPESEILVSAVTIPGMVQILAHHGLVPVPVDLDIGTASMSRAALEQRLTGKSRALLVAHLFGSRMPMDEIVRFAQQHQLLLFEDCAQAYDGADFRGDPRSDVTMFSFGTIKTHTALGSGILCIRDGALLEKMAVLQNRYRVQSRWAYLKRVLRTMLLLLLGKPRLFGLAVAALRRLGVNHDELLSKVVRGFPGDDLFARIRHQPCAPLLALLERRIRSRNLHSIRGRIALAEKMLSAMPGIRCPAQNAPFHQHWVVPMLSRSPDELIQLLWAAGFDATRKASSMSVVKTAQHGANDSPQASEMIDQTVYLPNHPAMSDKDVTRLATIVQRFEAF